MNDLINNRVDFLWIDNVYWPAVLPPSKISTGRYKPTLLLVDDDPLFCKGLTEAAKRRQIAVDVCHSAEELKRIVRPYDVALVDYYLGSKKGPDIVPMVKSPVVLISEV